ncbi:MAG: PspC domain-containing protein [Ardenticatenaceae bacterium]|nr:PspC domain-containing protein [Ardenticatenaceae bacterium]HBY99502.1 PspC domain-containing protein [Chloroflexota bacterium]
MSKRLYRSRDERIVAGVCGGIAEYLDVDPTLVRLAFILLSIGPFPGLLAYLIMMLVIPLEPLAGSERSYGIDEPQLPA